MPTTTHGFEYPDPADAISAYPAQAQATANKLESMVKNIQSGQINQSLAAGSGADVTVTFATPFPTVPIMVVSSAEDTASPENHVAAVRSVTATGAVVRVKNLGASTNTVSINWMAQG